MGNFQMDRVIARAVSRKLNMKSFLVWQQGNLIGSFYWGGRGRINVQSTAKSVTSLAIGIAVAQGILKLNDKPVDFFRRKLKPGMDRRIESLTVEHMLKMAVGHDPSKPIMPSAERDFIPDWLDHAMNLPFTTDPGVEFNYDNSAPYLLSAMLSERTEETMVDWLKPRLFDPLEIPNPQWFHCPDGYTAGSGGLFLTPEEIGRIGHLYLNEGVWNKKRLVPAEWIQEATRKQIDTGLPESPPVNHPLANTSFCGKDAASGYGYLIWMCANGVAYRSHGNFNQNFIVIPKKQAVVVTTADENQGQDILDIVWDEILPQL